MAKYINADCRLCRREGTKLFLKGERCTSKKCALDKRPGVPGMHPTTRKKPSQYALQLREKQKVKRAYGLLSIAHFLEVHLSPLRKSFAPSLLQSLQSAFIYFAIVFS